MILFSNADRIIPLTGYKLPETKKKIESKICNIVI